jgi:hypothetical protein
LLACPRFEIELRWVLIKDGLIEDRAGFTACKVFENVIRDMLMRSIVSKMPLSCPILPMAMPRPRLNAQSFTTMSVELALKEILSSPLSTIQLEKVRKEE